MTFLRLSISIGCGFPSYFASHLVIKGKYSVSCTTGMRFMSSRAVRLPHSKCVEVKGLHGFMLGDFFICNAFATIAINLPWPIHICKISYKLYNLIKMSFLEGQGLRLSVKMLIFVAPGPAVYSIATVTYLFLFSFVRDCVALFRESYNLVSERHCVSLGLCFPHQFDRTLCLLSSMFRFFYLHSHCSSVVTLLHDKSQCMWIYCISTTRKSVQIVFNPKKRKHCKIWKQN